MLNVSTPIGHGACWRAAGPVEQVDLSTKAKYSVFLDWNSIIHFLSESKDGQIAPVVNL
jgi:hypothetical protein